MSLWTSLLFPYLDTYLFCYFSFNFCIFLLSSFPNFQILLFQTPFYQDQFTTSNFLYHEKQMSYIVSFTNLFSSTLFSCGIVKVFIYSDSQNNYNLPKCTVNKPCEEDCAKTLRRAFWSLNN